MHADRRSSACIGGFILTNGSGPARLEVELQRELDNSRAIHGGEDRRVSAGHIHDPVISEELALRLRALEGGMVPDVEKLGAEFDRAPFRHLRALYDRHIPVLLERSAEAVA